MSGPRFASLATLGVIVVAAIFYAYYSPSFSLRDATPGTKTGSTARVVPVITAAAQIEDFKIRRRTIGIIESPAVVVIKSRIDSQVLQQHVTDGQLVRKGDLLFTLDDREIQALIARDEAQLAKDTAALAQAQAELERKQTLVDKKISPQQQLDQAIAAHKAAIQTVEADQAVLRADRLKLGYAKLEAPITGRIGAIRVTPGNLVSANDPTGLVTITQIRPIRAGFTLAERDLASLRKAFAVKPPAAVRVYTPGSGAPLEEGALDFVDSSVDTASGTISAKGRFDNAKFVLWPGMFVDVEIDLDVRPKTVMISAVAIQSGQKGPFVFVARNNQTAEMRNVEIAGIEGDRAAIASGVTEGEKVIVEGQMRLVTGVRIGEASPAGVKPEAKTKDGGAAQ